MVTQVERDIPEWAKERACELSNAIDDAAFITRDCTFGPMLAFARYIAAHEEAPVDPLLIEARDIASIIGGERGYHPQWAEEVTRGVYDCHEYVVGALAGLKRGIELAREQGA